MKPRYAVLAVAATLMIGCAQADDAAVTEDATTNVGPGANAEHVRAAVQRHFDAAGSGNAAALDSLSAPDLVHVDAAGDVHNEQQLIEQYRATPARYTAEKIDVRVYGDAAVVNARVVDANNQKLHVTQVWTLRSAARTVSSRTPAPMRSVKLVSQTKLVAQVYDTDAAAYEMVSMHVSAMSAAAAASDGAGPSDGAAADAAATTSESAMNKPAN